MNLLISETLPVDVVLDRAIPWMDDLYGYLMSTTVEDEHLEHEGRVASSQEPAWYDLRLSRLRQVIMDGF